MRNISVAMATYNGGKFLREQLDSILNQTIPVSELVICDDCSTDNTWSILCSYANRFSNFKIYKNTSNLGFLRNFEKAIKLCSGDYIALSDQDDIWLPDHLKLLSEKMGNKICVVGDAILIDSFGNKSNFKLSYCQNLDFIPDDDLRKAYFIMFYKNPYQGASMMFHKEFLDKALPIPDGVKFHDTWFSLLSCFYKGFQPIDDIVTLYRRHEDTVTNNKYRKPKIYTFISHLLYCRPSYRPAMIDAIRRRVIDLNDDQKVFLDYSYNYYCRRKTFIGRLLNSLFELKNSKLIYGNNLNKYRFIKK